MIAWLDAAYAMETQSLPAMCVRAAAVHELGATRPRMEEHIHETKGHVERLRQALDSLGSSPSKACERMAPLGRLATIAPAANSSGRAVQEAIVSYAAEQFEVASYTALIAAAEHVGEPQIARLCRLNRSEDEDMAEWLEARIGILIPHAFALNEHL